MEAWKTRTCEESLERKRETCGETCGDYPERKRETCGESLERKRETCEPICVEVVETFLEMTCETIASNEPAWCLSLKDTIFFCKVSSTCCYIQIDTR